MTGNVLSVIIGYFVGAIPLGLLLGKVLKGVDVRHYGSGKTGATNVLRTLGPRAAVPVAIFDMGKGVAAFYIATALGDSRWAEVAAAMAAFVGHNWSIFIRFTGGRGVSTSLGGLFAVAPVWAAATFGAGVLVVGATRYVSLGSLAGALFTFGILLGLAATGHEPWTSFAYGATAAAFIFFQHRDNIQRLVQGRERRLGQKVALRPVRER